MCICRSIKAIISKHSSCSWTPTSAPMKEDGWQTVRATWDHPVHLWLENFHRGPAQEHWTAWATGVSQNVYIFIPYYAPLIWWPTRHRSHGKLFLRFFISSVRNEQCDSYPNFSNNSFQPLDLILFFAAWKETSFFTRNLLPWRHSHVWPNGLLTISLVNQTRVMDPW